MVDKPWVGLAAILAVVVYVGTAYFLFPPQAIWAPDEGAKLLQMMSLRFERGQLRIDIPYAGRDLDPEMRYVSQFAKPDRLLQVSGNRLYFGRLPVFPLLVKPLFEVFGAWGLYVVPILSGVATPILSGELVAHSEKRVAMTFLIMFGSPVFLYSTIFWEHTLAVSLGLAGAYLMLHGESERPMAVRDSLIVVASGVSLALALFVRLETLIFIGALIVAYGIVYPRRRRRLILILGVIGVALVLYVYSHQWLMGHSLPGNARFLHNLSPMDYVADVRWRAIPALLFSVPADGSYAPGLIGDIGAVAAVLAVAFSALPFVSGRDKGVILLRDVGLGVSALVSAAFLFKSDSYRSAHGLMSVTPWVLLAVCRMREVWRGGSLRARVIALTATLGLAVTSLALLFIRAPYTGMHAGLEWGNRYIMALYPLLAIMAMWPTENRRRRFLSLLLVAAFMFLGIGYQIRGIRAVWYDKQISRILDEKIAAVPERNIVSDLWWLPLDTAPLYPTKAIYYAPMVSDLVDWIGLAAANGVRRFGLVTLEPEVITGLFASVPGYELRILDYQRVNYLCIFRLKVVPKSG